MGEDLASGIIFVKENREILTKHYKEVTKDAIAIDTLPLELSGLLDPIKGEDTVIGDIDVTDVGQDLF